MVLGVLAEGGLIIGLSYANVQRLMDGHPIDKQCNYPDLKGRLVILAGPTEEFLVSFLKKVGSISEETKDMRAGEKPDGA